MKTCLLHRLWKKTIDNNTKVQHNYILLKQKLNIKKHGLVLPRIRLTPSDAGEYLCTDQKSGLQLCVVWSGDPLRASTYFCKDSAVKGDIIIAASRTHSCKLPIPKMYILIYRQLYPIAPDIWRQCGQKKMFTIFSVWWMLPRAAPPSLFRWKQRPPLQARHKEAGLLRLPRGAGRQNSGGAGGGGDEESRAEGRVVLVQCSTEQCSVVQCSAVQYRAVQYRAV